MVNVNNTYTVVAKAFAVTILVLTAPFASDALAVGPSSFSSHESHHNNLHIHAPDPPKKLPPPLPKTQNPYTLLGFDWLSPPKDFDAVHRAYRQLARRYHPDVVVGPDAPAQKREAATLDFLRINEAYEKLKARRDEEIFEIIVMGNGRVEKQYYSTSEERRKSDPDRINVQRILELRERFPNAKRRSWSDGKYTHPPGGRHNGDFGPIRR
ncbi:hypothetical protein ACHAWX_000092 [Stephanocyclus meneghinianus]